MGVPTQEANRLLGADALRGVAALAVFAEHSGFLPIPIEHGYLAVDFFFMLSGFVIAMVYERRLAEGLSPSYSPGAEFGGGDRGLSL